ncbi:hypothetical protein N7523_007231 [Penicillium sp. IBT 18751x]|nr:hypothetical protein N7523_007231 [Penicillium sp. IBT 18751x]
MQDFKLYSVDGKPRSLTVPLPDDESTPFGQSTAHSKVNMDPSEPVIVVRFCPGHGFAATPVVPVVTGADDVADAVVEAVVVEDCGIEDAELLGVVEAELLDPPTPPPTAPPITKTAMTNSNQSTESLTPHVLLESLEEPALGEPSSSVTGPALVGPDT